MIRNTSNTGRRLGMMMKNSSYLQSGNINRIPYRGYCAISTTHSNNFFFGSNTRNRIDMKNQFPLSHSYTSSLLFNTNFEHRRWNSSAVESSKSDTKKSRSRSPSRNDTKKKGTVSRRRKVKKISQQERDLETALERGGEHVIRVEKDIPQYSEQAIVGIKQIPQMTFNGVKMLLNGCVILVTDPIRARDWMRSMKVKIQKEAKHYWLGTKLLYADVTTSTRIIRRLLRGNSLSRRERKQLQRTVTDLLRLVPFSFFIIIPFMELLLPVALKLFPNMLPSTYQDQYIREENMKRQLRLRLSLAEFLQEAVKDVMQDTRDSENTSEEKRATANEVLDFIERAQSGQPLNSEEILKFASLFNDELMLDNISRPQLVGMCRYMGLQSYGNDNFLRFQIRGKIRSLKKDDQSILWEGLDSLTKEELQQACMDRGMKAVGLTKIGYKRQMNNWLDLSINKNVPASLLIMSRALNITALEKPEVALATSMSSMDEEVVTEVALEAAGDGSAELRELKLESIRYQNELIADEEKEREDAKKKAEALAAAAATAAPNIPASPVDKEPAISKEASIGEPTLTTSKDEELPIEPVMEDTAATSEKQERELTLEEVSALESLAFKSSVEKERKVLDNIKQSKLEMDVDGLLSAGRIGSQSKENKSANRMLQKLETMLSSLEQEIEMVDQTIGDRLNLLDRDNDGVVSVDELKTAIKTILREHNTEEEVEWAVSQIDEDQDGRVSVEELVQWIEKRSDLIELTGRTSNPSNEDSTTVNPEIKILKRSSNVEK